MDCTTTVIIMLCFLLSSCDSLHIHQQEHDTSSISSQPAILPRKLKVAVTQEQLNIKSHEASDSTLHYNPEDAHVSGKQHHKVSDRVHVKGGTWKEWEEGTDDTPTFFTMDYSRVRRRRPIHNKSLHT